MKRQKLFDKFYTRTGKARRQSEGTIDLSYPCHEIKQHCLKNETFFASKARSPQFIYNERFKKKNKN